MSRAGDVEVRYGGTAGGSVDHLVKYQVASGRWRAYCGRALDFAGRVPVDDRICQRCVETRDRANG